ncbi:MULTISPECIES: GNAT family N-acetyltransferase [Sphingobacterium]|uniref:GNAT family N-acetyltransferase n=1 Tax=Sphingobacterium tenebrionis TaxID=3111775 RepID=A0ABU8I697_9SPHI|nr:GNAT family N-acetyltransferase [Sphingobacterium sp. CZ-2]QBR11858.1 GNAT family N-acetyltransferase [Sphingobacterium sp. CZ-2]
MEINIRPYDTRDRESLLQVLNSNIPTYFHPDELEDFKSYLDKELEDYFVLEVDGKVVAGAGINYELSENLAKLSWDFISSDWQQQGLGSRLMQHRLGHILSNPAIKHITVRTSQLAEEFYAKHGFVEVERKKDYWAEGFDMVKMQYAFTR